MSLRAFGRTVGESVGKRVGRIAGRLHETTPLPADVLESEDAYLVIFDAPGVETSDVQVRYSDRTVRVRIDRFREFREGYEMRFPGRGLALDGSARLPADAAVDPDAATATLREDGTLAVEIPKRDSRETDSDPDSTTDDASSDADGDGPEEDAVDLDDGADE